MVDNWWECEICGVFHRFKKDVLGCCEEAYMSEQIVKAAKALCEKFVNKVETGKAHSKETYAECRALLELINENNQEFKKDASAS